MGYLVNPGFYICIELFLYPTYLPLQFIGQNINLTSVLLTGSTSPSPFFMWELITLLFALFHQSSLDIENLILLYMP